MQIFYFWLKYLMLTNNAQYQANVIKLEMLNAQEGGPWPPLGTNNYL